MIAVCESVEANQLFKPLLYKDTERLCRSKLSW